MDNRHTTIQFTRDGLFGTTILALIYLLLWWAISFLLNLNLTNIASTWHGLFVLFSPGVFFMIAMFVCTGINIRVIKNENIQERKDWAKPILKMLQTALLVTFPTALLYLVFLPIILNLYRLIQYTNFDHGFLQAFLAIYGALVKNSPGMFFIIFYYFFEYSLFIIFGSMIGLLGGFVATSLAASIFNPQKQSTRILIPIIANLSVFIISSLSVSYFFSVLLLM